MSRAQAGAASLGIRAPAKLNLFLHVLGRRDDGYHILDSLIAFTEAGDDLVVRAAGALSLSCDGPFAAALGDAGDDNLVLRAARALAGAAGVAATAGAAVTLTKNLPVASGIGGGSSDAAAALVALRALWRAEIDEDRLAALAHALGADVPVCLAGVPSRVGGIGERICPAPALPRCGVLLVNPGVPVPTAEVFRRCRPAGGEASDRLPVFGDAAGLAAALADRRNDLEAPALAVAPAIGAVLAALRAQPGCLLARLSGSGATCFGLFEEDAAAATGAQRIGHANPRWWVRATRFRDARAEPAPG